MKKTNNVKNSHKDKKFKNDEITKTAETDAAKPSDELEAAVEQWVERKKSPVLMDSEGLPSLEGLSGPEAIRTILANCHVMKGWH